MLKLLGGRIHDYYQMYRGNVQSVVVVINDSGCRAITLPMLYLEWVYSWSASTNTKKIQSNDRETLS